MVKIIRATSSWINRLPLAGKITLRPMLLNVYCETQRSKKYWKILGICSFLLFFIYMHWLQALMGWTGYIHQSNVAWGIICLVYAGLNILVCYTQTVLFFRALSHTVRFARGRIPKNVKHTFPSYSTLYKALCFVVTMTGQIVILCIL